MKIFFDIGHPAHVHYFKNLIYSLNINHKNLIHVYARDKDVSLDLLNTYKINFINRGKGSNRFFGKFIYMIRIVIKLSFDVKKIKPDCLVSFNSPYFSIISKIFNIDHFCFNDTEHAKIGNIFSSSFSNYIITPDCFTKDYGEKHVKFRSYMEFSYLSAKYFKPNKNILNKLKENTSDQYILFRFVSWNAAHDFGYKGMTLSQKIKLVGHLEKYAKIYISSEDELPKELDKYKLPCSPEEMHSVLSFADLFIGEGATMASECAVLGTPAIYINKLSAGTLNDQASRGLITQFENYDFSLVAEKAKSLLCDNLEINKLKDSHKKMIKEKIETTDFMIDLLKKTKNKLT
tara:strand:- start:13919 stop:14959 length:1041 start_codon:yes stop_codon:yes gene_type:complete